MRIAAITAGAAGMFSGACLHDNPLPAPLVPPGPDALPAPPFPPTRPAERGAQPRPSAYTGHMRIAAITAGAAGMFCGSCLHDNTLAAALVALGHDALLVPTFTPIRTDEEDVSAGRVFLGGINVYLDQYAAFRRLPGFARRWLDRPGLLRWVERF